MDLLITNARVWGDRPPVDIGIEGERIAAIEPGIDADAGRTIDARGRAVLPRFVAPHLHLHKGPAYPRQPAAPPPRQGADLSPPARARWHARGGDPPHRPAQGRTGPRRRPRALARRP